MRRSHFILATLLSLVIALMAPMSATAQTVTDEPGTGGGHDYIVVTLTGQPAAYEDGAKTNGRFDPSSKGYAQALNRMERQHQRLADRLAQVAPDAEIVEQYFITANAVAIQLNGESRSVVDKLPGVARSASSELYSLDMDQSVGLIDAPAFWGANSGRAGTGTDVKIGIIDSGILPDHPFFSCKTVHFGGVYASGRGILPSIPATSAIFGPHYSPEPGWPLYFSSDHGTHVAGTAAGCVTTVGAEHEPWGGTTISGVAPGADLYDYNVFPAFGAGYVAFGGSAFSHDIAAAIEDAVEDGMDVINMSLGGGVQGPHDFLAEASNAAVAAGVTVVTSAGNEGPGAYTVGSPGSASEVIAVGASTNTRGMAVTATTGNGNVYEAVPGDFPDFPGVQQSLIAWPGSDPEACSDADAGTLAGEVTLISRGSCSFSQKIANAKAAGAGGVIVYNNQPGDAIGMARTAGFDDDLPAVMVTDVDGTALLGESPTTVLVTPPTVVPTDPNRLAGFSSEGPAPFTYQVKPDVLAPGVNILSSIFGFDLLGPTDPDGWALANGTSMASPHVAGAAAALLEVHPSWGPDEVKSAMVTTADRNLPEDLSVWEQGGGLLDLPGADSATVTFYPSNASFGISKGNKPANMNVDIAISAGAACTANATGSGYVSADVDGSLLTVSFAGGRDADTGFYDGYVDVDCGADGTYSIPWGAVIRR